MALQGMHVKFYTKNGKALEPRSSQVNTTELFPFLKFILATSDSTGAFQAQDHDGTSYCMADQLSSVCRYEVTFYAPSQSYSRKGQLLVGLNVTKRVNDFAVTCC